LSVPVGDAKLPHEALAAAPLSRGASGRVFQPKAARASGARALPAIVEPFEAPDAAPVNIVAGSITSTRRCADAASGGATTASAAPTTAKTTFH
jgi:hypothetical protein